MTTLYEIACEYYMQHRRDLDARGGATDCRCDGCAMFHTYLENTPLIRAVRRMVEDAR